MATTINRNIPVDSGVVGFIVGTKGATINMIKSQTGAHVQIRQPNPDEGRPWPWVHIRGFPHQVSAAADWVQTIVDEGHTRSGTQATTGTAMRSVMPPQPVRMGYADGVVHVPMSSHPSHQHHQHHPHGYPSPQYMMSSGQPMMIPGMSMAAPTYSGYHSSASAQPALGVPPASVQTEPVVPLESDADRSARVAQPAYNGELTAADLEAARQQIEDSLRREYDAKFAAFKAEITEEMLRAGETIEDAENQAAAYGIGGAFEFDTAVEQEQADFERETIAAFGPQVVYDDFDAENA